MLLTITDEAGDSGSVTVDKHEVAKAITPWYPDAPAEVTETIAELQSALDRARGIGVYLDGFEAALGIKIEVAEVDATATG